MELSGFARTRTRSAGNAKIRLYDACQDSSAQRFRVLIVTTRSAARLLHILDAAAELVRNPQRSLFYGICLDDYLRQSDALSSRCFRDHSGKGVVLHSKEPIRRAVQPKHCLAAATTP
jgi:hypothetical protein